MNFYKTNIWCWPQVYNGFKNYEEEGRVKFVKIIKLPSTYKTIFNYFLLSIIFMISLEDLIFIFYILVLNTARGHHTKKRI